MSRSVANRWARSDFEEDHYCSYDEDDYDYGLYSSLDETSVWLAGGHLEGYDDPDRWWDGYDDGDDYPNQGGGEWSEPTIAPLSGNPAAAHAAQKLRHGERHWRRTGRAPWVGSRRRK